MVEVGTFYIKYNSIDKKAFSLIKVKDLKQEMANRTPDYIIDIVDVKFFRSKEAIIFQETTIGFLELNKTNIYNEISKEEWYIRLSEILYMCESKWRD